MYVFVFVFVFIRRYSYIHFCNIFCSEDVLKLKQYFVRFFVRFAIFSGGCFFHRIHRFEAEDRNS